MNTFFWSKGPQPPQADPAVCTSADRLEILAQWLEAGAPRARGVSGFDLSIWRNEGFCGTVCCLAGTAVAWWGKGRGGKPEEGSDWIADGGKILGLPFEDARDLFLGIGLPGKDGSLAGNKVAMSGVTPQQAARVIRNYQKTGKVDWIIK